MSWRGAAAGPLNVPASSSSGTTNNVDAGSAGFMVFYVHPDKRESVQQTLSQYLNVPFRFESKGCRLLPTNDSARDLA